MTELVPWTSPVLYRPADKFDFEQAPVHPVELANKLIETMVAKRGIGLAAPQIGLGFSAFVMWGSPAVVCFNAKVVGASDKQEVLEEGCLSYPGLTLKIKRPSVIRMRFQTQTGETITRRFEGLTAHTAQHEIDHILGIPFFARVSRLKLDAAIRKANKSVIPPYSLGALHLAAKEAA